MIDGGLTVQLQEKFGLRQAKLRDRPPQATITRSTRWTSQMPSHPYERFR